MRPDAERDRDDVRAIVATAELAIEQIARSFRIRPAVRETDRNSAANRVTRAGFLGSRARRTEAQSMTDSARPRTPPELQPSNAMPAASDAGRTVMVGVLGGIVSAAGYLVYQRLPDEQKDRLQRQVRGLLESRINEIRQNFNL